MRTRLFKLFFCLLPLLLSLKPMEMEAQPKGYLYDEEKVLLTTYPISYWGWMEKNTNRRGLGNQASRPEILRLFEKEVFGRSPKKPNPLRFEVVEEASQALKGKAKRKQILIHLGKGKSLLPSISSVSEWYGQKFPFLVF